jgi:hypothetical protein
MANAPDGPVEKKKLYSDGTALRFAAPGSGDFPPDDLSTVLAARALNEAALPTRQPVRPCRRKPSRQCRHFPRAQGITHEQRPGRQ